MSRVAFVVEALVERLHICLPELVGVAGQERRQLAIQQFGEVGVLAVAKELPELFIV